MTPAALQASSFARYPPAAQVLARQHLQLLRAMPLALLPGYLVQIREYGTQFPLEEQRLRLQLDALAERPRLMDDFRAIALPSALQGMDWLQNPAAFVGALAGALWQTGQIDAYHRAAEALFAALPQAPRLSGSAPWLIAVFGRDATPGRYPLFARLRKGGFYARKVTEVDAEQTLGALLQARSAASPAPYTHWYVDGGAPWPLPVSSGAVERFTYPQLAPVTDAILREMDRAVQDGIGPEALADRLHGFSPQALAMDRATGDPRMQRFFLSLLTESSGTQLYSTSFVQAAAVALVRRAQPETLLLRFAPRRRPASMNDMLEQRGQSAALDADGALVDADMAVYYSWLALQHQPRGEQARLLALVEGHGEAFAAGPGVVRGGESETPMTVAQLCALLQD